MKDKYKPELQMSLFPKLDDLAKNEDKKELISISKFDKNLKGILKISPPKKDK